MRSALRLLMATVLAIIPVARAQTASGQSAVTQQAASQQAAIQPTAVQQTAVRPTAAPRPTPPRHSPSRHATGTARAEAAAGKADGTVDLGATDITGNKELPKVMVIVPWKDSLGAGGVKRPTDSLLDEVLQPVDRGVFQRQIRYFGQLNAAARPPASGLVAPVGDSH